MKKTAIPRNDFVNLFFRDDFFERNPAFQPAQESVSACRAAYQASGKPGCGCGKDFRLVHDCLAAVKDLLVEFKDSNPEAVTALASYISEVRNDKEPQQFTLYYRKTIEDPLVRIPFP